jgi:2-C-methyl-D-erythritol 4-phosphate cytidylyltransferase
MANRTMDAVILAAGAAKRMEQEVPKQFLRIGGKPVIIYVMEVLQKAEIFNRLIVTTLPGFEAHYDELIKTYHLTDIELVAGGATRQESCRLALEKVRSGRVLIHEAARPFITVDFVRRLIGYPDLAVVPVLPIDFTVSAGGEFMTKSLERGDLKNVQLPQVFDTRTIVDAHQHALADGFFATEDSTLVFRMGIPVRFVEGLRENFKITDRFDLFVAERIKQMRDESDV